MGMIDHLAAAGRRSRLRRAANMALLAAALAITSACATLYRNHGYIPLEEDLAQLQIGVDSRETVLAKVGSPTSGGVLDQSGYYFVASRFRHIGFLEPQEIDRQVLALSFDGAGLLSNVERFGLEDGQVVVLSRRVTAENVRDTTFIRQLLGNLGNFDAGALLANEP